MKRNNIVYFILMLLPIIDLTTSLNSRLAPGTISIGALFKGLLIVFAYLYVLILSKSKYKKVSKYFYIFIVFYIISYFLFNNELLSLNYLFTEMNYMLKLIYMPVMTFALLNYFDEYGFDKKLMTKVLIFSFILYILLITVPTILNINFKSYDNPNYSGSIGLFYSANEVSTILLLMFPFVYSLITEKKILGVILFSAGLYTISLIGTKVTLFGVVIVTFMIFVVALCKIKKINKNVFLIFIMFLVATFVMYNGRSSNNMQDLITKEQEKEQEEIREIEENLNNNMEPLQENTFLVKTLKFGSKLLSNRDVYALNTYLIFDKNFEKSYLFYGMGYSNTDRINDRMVSKLIEIDVLDIFFHMGIFGLLILMFPFLYILYVYVNLRKKKVYKLTFAGWFYLLMILMTIGISSTAGHVYLAPAVSIYVSLYFAYLFYDFNLFNKRKINNNKISILALHLGYGGVENAIINEANMLSSKYEVEIISLYKQKFEIPFNVNKNVKITYLMNNISNRNVFLESVHKFDVINIFKEGYKAVKILLNKNNLLIKAILNSDAKIILSTRYEFSKILSKYRTEDIITLHQQHVFDISNKYMDNLNKLDIDYVLPVSNYMTKKYRKYLNKKVEYLPLAISNVPKKSEISNLKNKNLIAIGRLEEIKGFEDLIYIMKEIIKVDSEVNLNIFGDGSLKNKLIDIINNENLNNNISLWGFKPQEFINKYLTNSCLYMMTSFEESLGLVVIEAMSFGLPIITFDTAEGVLENVDSKNGFIIRNRDKHKMAKEVINYLKLDTNKKSELGNNSILKSNFYQFENVKVKWINFIEGILKESL